MAETGGERTRRPFWRVVGVGLGGSAVAALASSRPWVIQSGAHSVVTDSAFTGTEDSARSPVALAVALVLLAAWGVLLVTRGAVRRAFAVIATLAAAALVVAVVAGHQQLPGQLRDSFVRPGGSAPVAGFSGWFWVAGGCAVLALAAGVTAVLFSPRWPEMSRAYDAPTGPASAAGGTTPPGEAQRDEELSNRRLWDQLSEGHDPTSRRDP